MSFHISKRSFAFTLIELLVVISIVGVLVAMLLPALSKSRETARRVLCQGSLRMNGVAFNAYGQDFKDWLPFPTIQSWLGYPIAMDAGMVYNQGALFPYLNYDPRTLYCPDMMTPIPGTMPYLVNSKLGAELFVQNWNTTRQRAYTSYGMPLRWENPAAPPTLETTAWWNVYDVYKEQNDSLMFISLKLSPNLMSNNSKGKNYPIMGCLQEWANNSYGGHEGKLSNLVYADGVVKPMEYPFRQYGIQWVRDAAAWEVMKNLY